MIHKLSEIHPNAKIHSSVEIGPFVTIEDDVEIGEGTSIAPNVTIMAGTRIGRNCRIFPNAVLGAIPQDLKFAGEYSTVEIGNNTTIRECVTVNRGTVDRNKTVVGSNVLLMAYAHVAHDCIVEDNVILANAVNLGGHVIIEKHAIVGGGGLVHQFCRVGQHAMISGGTVLTQDVPPFITVGRTPASFAGVNTIGLNRRGFENQTISDIESCYRIIYNSSRNRTQALDHLEVEVASSTERDAIITFIKSSNRGIIKRPKK